MNRALIDTDILSYYFRGDEKVKKNFRDYLKFFDKIETSIITHYEIVGGLLAKRCQKATQILRSIHIAKCHYSTYRGIGWHFSRTIRKTKTNWKHH